MARPVSPLAVLSFLITPLLLLGCPREKQEPQLVYVDSAGNVIPITAENAHEFAAPARPTKRLKGLSGITWNITYEDVDGETGEGFDDPVEGEDRRDRAEEVLQYISDTLNPSPVTLDVVFKLSIDVSGSGTLAFAGTSFFLTEGFTGGIAFQHITTGSDPSGGSDINCTVNFGKNFYAGTGDPGSGQSDLFSVLLHEITHGLGFLSLSEADGLGGLVDQFEVRHEKTLSLLDKDILTGNGNLMWDETATLVGQASYLLGSDDGLFYPGFFTSAAFGGTAPGIYAPSTYEDGSSTSHWDTGNVGGAVMEHQILTGTKRRTYSDIDLAALRDFGYTGIDTPPLVDYSDITYSVAEDGASILITVNLDEAPGTGNTAAIDFATSDGSATAGEDYTSNSGTLTFGAAETSKTFSVTILEDGDDEPDETVTLTLSNPVDCWMVGVNGPATLTITDNDVATTTLWVDFGVAPGGAGTEGDPFGTLAEANTAASGLTVVKIKSNVTPESPEIVTLTNAMTVQSEPAATVRVGVSGAKSGAGAWQSTQVEGGAAYGNDAARLSAAAVGGLPVARRIALGGMDGGDEAGGGADGAEDGGVYELVLPRSQDENGTHLAEPDAPLFLRLRSAGVIDAATLWADVPATGRHAAELIGTGSAGDAWVRVSPGIAPGDGVVTLQVGGAGAGSNGAAFLAVAEGASGGEVAQPAVGTDFAVIGGGGGQATLVAAGAAAPADAVTSVYTVAPEAAYEAPLWVWVEVPSGLADDAMTLVYHFGDAWVSAGSVRGWLSGDAYRVESGGKSYVGFQVRHAGTFAVTETP